MFIEVGFLTIISGVLLFLTAKKIAENKTAVVGLRVLSVILMLIGIIAVSLVIIDKISFPLF